MADLLTTPQLAFPFNVSGSSVRTIEQDSEEDLENRVVTVLLYVLGQRPGVSDFGIPDQALRKNGGSVEEIVSAVARWVPEVKLDILRGMVEDGMQKITIMMEAKEGPNG